MKDKKKIEIKVWTGEDSSAEEINAEVERGEKQQLDYVLDLLK